MPRQKGSATKWHFEKHGETIRIFRKGVPIKKPGGQEYGGVIKIAAQTSDVENNKLKVALSSLFYFY